VAEHVRVDWPGQPRPPGQDPHNLPDRRGGHWRTERGMEQIDEHELSRTRRYLDLAPGMCFWPAIICWRSQDNNLAVSDSG
jgi:hypothetical protein